MASSSFKCADAPGVEPSAARLADGDADAVPALLHRANVSDLLRAGRRVLGPAGPSYGLRDADRGGVVAAVVSSPGASVLLPRPLVTAGRQRGADPVGRRPVGTGR